MNCQSIRVELINGLASGETPIAGEVAAHVRECAGCQAFYKSQSTLFHSMNSGLQVMANQAVPPSLVPGLRARLDQEPLMRRAWFPGWSFAAAIAVVAILVASLGFVLHRPAEHPNLPGSEPIASRSVDNPAPLVQSAQKRASAPRRRVVKRAGAPVPAIAPAEALPEVIVLAEERRAFAQFVAELPEERNLALALTKPAQTTPDAPIEIALLQIERLDVKPLEATSRE